MLAIRGYGVTLAYDGWIVRYFVSHFNDIWTNGWQEKWMDGCSDSWKDERNNTWQ